MALIKLPQQELEKLAKMSIPRCLHELRKKGINHAIVANPQNPRRQKIWFAKNTSENNMLWFWRNHKKAILIIIYTMENCKILRVSKQLIEQQKHE